MSGSDNSTDTVTAGLGHNQPPRTLHNVVGMFSKAVSDLNKAEHHGTTATARFAATALAFYTDLYGDTTADGTMHLLTQWAGADHYDRERAVKFRAELLEALDVRMPVATDKGVALSVEYASAKAEFLRLQTAITRGIEFACDLMQGETFDAPATPASRALEWFNSSTGLFTVPYKLVLMRGQHVAGKLMTAVIGTPGKDNGNPDYTVAIDGKTRLAAQDDSGRIDLFRCDVSRVQECAKSRRVTPVTKETRDRKTGEVTVTTVMSSPAEKFKARAGRKPVANAGRAPGAPSAPSAPVGRPVGSTAEAAGGASKELEFSQALRLAVQSITAILKEPEDNSDPTANYWSADPALASQVDDAINMLTMFRERRKAFEAKHKADVAKRMAAGAAAENKAEAKRTRANGNA